MYNFCRSIFFFKKWRCQFILDLLYRPPLFCKIHTWFKLKIRLNWHYLDPEFLVWQDICYMFIIKHSTSHWNPIQFCERRVFFINIVEIFYQFFLFFFDLMSFVFLKSKFSCELTMNFSKQVSYYTVMSFENCLCNGSNCWSFVFRFISYKPILIWFFKQNILSECFLQIICTTIHIAT